MDQSVDPGDNAQLRLEKLSLPVKLTGKSLVDIQCGEGFFCFEAARRGAKRVVGLDQAAQSIKTARTRAKQPNACSIEFYEGDIRSLPDGLFDFVLVLSSTHCIQRPIELFQTILRHLAPNGRMIFECGVAQGEGRVLRRALRAADERFFPTYELLRDVWLQGYSVRAIGESIDEVGDPVPRQVLHCSPRRTTVIFIGGPGELGKTSLALEFKDAILIHTDQLFSPFRTKGRRFTPPMQSNYDRAKVSNNHSTRKAWQAVRADPAMRRFCVETIVNAIRQCSGAKTIVVEGFHVADLVEHVVAELEPEMRCWTTNKHVQNEPLK